MEIFPENWKWEPGLKRSGMLPIYGGGGAFPVTLLCGDRPGPTVLVTGGIHSAEYVGIQAVMELIQELRQESVTGSLILIPLVNISGFEHRTMSIVYEDRKNLNRVFPGRPDGTAAERIAYTLTETFIRKADAYIDLHCGDGYEELIPFVFCQGFAKPDVAKKSREMADLVHVPYLVATKDSSEGAYNYAGSVGVPGILIERGGMGLWGNEEVEADKLDVRRVLHYLGTLDQAPGSPSQASPVQLYRYTCSLSDYTGCWYPVKQVGEHIFQEEVLGEVRDYFGQTIQVCRAREDGVILFQAKSLNILKGGPMVCHASPDK